MPTVRDATHASELLAKRHAAFRSLVRAVGPCPLRVTRGGSHFATLASTIAYQQLNGTAAATIWGRVVTTVGGRVTPEAVLATSELDLRAAGLSTAKVASLIDLATKADDGTLRLARISRYDDEDAIAMLSEVRGIGRWSAEMFLMHRLGRLDIWPVGDYGVRKGYAIVHGLADMPDAKVLDPLGEPYRGYRSVAAWYCWQATDRSD